jgi:hypothetical protein
MLLGLWGGLAPFVGPYFHFGFSPDKAWAYNDGRLYYSVIPGAAALVGGALTVLTRNRGVGIIGGVLAVLGGAWFGLGQQFVSVVLNNHTITVGTPLAPGGLMTVLRTYLETLTLFYGLGFVIVFLGALAVGRFSLLSAHDVRVDADGYHSGPPANTVAGEFPSAAGHLPDEPARYGETTTASLPPSNGT